MEDLIDTLTDLQQRVSATIEEVVRRARLRTASDAELTDAVARAGGIARSVDALLVESVGELADRSRSVDRAERLTTRMGCRDVGELVRRLIRCSSHTARQLGSAQRAVALEWDPISGEARPAMLPAMRAALLRGDVGVDGVLAAAGPLLAMRDRVDRGRLMLADEAVAAQAREDGPDGAPPACADLLRVHA
ncbi:MAG: HNH endonuclease, partial [Microbacterium sp.]|nr:HNH endonuclease [Microbacterium sp.]